MTQTHSVTFIHTSDLQLGMTRWFFDADAQARFSAARVEAITRLGQLAQDTGAQFIVVAGDVFEHNSLSAQTTGRAREALAALPVPVYLLPGNHDPLVADSVFFKATADNVHVIEDSEPFEVAPGVELVGAPYRSKHANHDLVAAALAPLEPVDTIRIMVGHGQVESRDTDKAPDLIDLPTVEEAIRAGTIEYLALGDTHSTTNLSSTGAVWFSGAPETTDFATNPAGGGESDSGNALVVTVSKTDGQAQVTVDKRQVGQWTFEALDRDINSLADVTSFITELRAYPQKDRTAIKYGLTGTLSLSAHAQLQSELAELEPVFASLKERERTTDLHLEPEPEELSNLGITGYAAGALEEIVDSLESDPVARDAANLLFRLARKGA